LAGHYADAETSFLNALGTTSESDPTTATIQHSLGLLYTEVGRYPEAEFVLREALGSKSNGIGSAATAKQLGDVVAALGRRSEA